MIDKLVASDAPLIFCVGVPDQAGPIAGAPLAQRRIDLLAIEQNGWVLAGLDRRCVVVETRTELDWAMKNGQICVWAPSKIVLDAVDGPVTQHSEGVALAAWFSGLLGACEMLVIGETPPGDVPVPVRALTKGAELF